MQYLGAIYDAMRAIGLDAKKYYINIKPQAGYKNISDGYMVCGPVFTTKGRVTTAEDNYEELDAIRYDIYEKFNDHFKKHKPIVALEANDNKVAHTGDITSLIYKKMGSVGMITDGITRDANVINRIGYPVFSTDTNPIDAIDYWAIVDYDCTIVIKGVKINPMDWAFADRDGIMIVPKDRLEEFSVELQKVYDKEDKIRSQIESSLDIREIFNKNGRW